MVINVFIITTIRTFKFSYKENPQNNGQNKENKKTGAKYNQSSNISTDIGTLSRKHIIAIISNNFRNILVVDGVL